MAKVKTAQKILDCATQMFASLGYAGTIMDELARRCEVNKASIYYHHKDKATLYENALIALFTPIADTVVGAVNAADDPLDKLERHIKTFARANAENPYFAPILMREMASGGVNISAPARAQMQRILLVLNSLLQLGAAQQRFKPADPIIIHFMIIGTINLFVTTTPLRQSLPETVDCPQLQSGDIELAAEQIYQTIAASLLLE